MLLEWNSKSVSVKSSGDGQVVRLINLCALGGIFRSILTKQPSK